MPDKYVDAYVMPVPKSKVDGYKTFSKKIGDFVKKHGALEYVDCIADDVKPGKQTSFPQAVQLGADETMMLSWADPRPTGHAPATPQSDWDEGPTTRIRNRFDCHLRCSER